MDELTCPGCSATLSPRRLVFASTFTESCPHCQSVVRGGDGFRYENTHARTTEDVAGVDTWLAEECAQLRQTCQPVRDREASGEYQWEIAGDLLTGCPSNWFIEVRYQVRTPNILAVRVVAVEPEWLSDSAFESFRQVFQDHGLQPHGSRTGTVGIGAGCESRWGTEQYLSIGPLALGLFRPVVTRLLTAMRDALTTRQHRQL